MSCKTRFSVYLTLTFVSKASNHCDKYDHLGPKMKEGFRCYEQNRPMDRQKDKQMRPITILYIVLLKKKNADKIRYSGYCKFLAKHIQQRIGAIMVNTVHDTK